MLRRKLQRWWYEFLKKLYFRPCHGCPDKSFHTHHLTRLGRAVFVRVGRKANEE